MSTVDEFQPGEGNAGQPVSPMRITWRIDETRQELAQAQARIRELERQLAAWERATDPESAEAVERVARGIWLEMGLIFSWEGLIPEQREGFLENIPAALRAVRQVAQQGQQV